MSRSYRVLALALVGVLAMGGLAKLVGSTSAESRDAAVSAATTVPTATTVATATEVATIADGTEPTLAPGEVTDVVDGDQETTSTTAPAQTAECSITEVLKAGSSGDQVACLEQQLAAAGHFNGPTDSTFDAATDSAVRAYQAAEALEVDGIVGRQTAQSMGIWAGPLGPIPATNDDCPSTPHGAIVDRANQRGALCKNGVITYEFAITTAWSQPDPGTYPVYAKDLNASSTISGAYSTMTHFVAFTRGKYQGARIAFHSMPKYSNGEYLMPLDTLGNPDYRGQSSGCIRVHPDDAVKIWDWLDEGDEVRVIS